jgi:hypothetical protein
MIFGNGDCFVLRSRNDAPFHRAVIAGEAKQSGLRRGYDMSPVAIVTERDRAMLRPVD